MLFNQRNSLFATNIHSIHRSFGVLNCENLVESGKLVSEQGDNFFIHDGLLSLQPGMRIDFNLSFVCTESINWLEKKRAVRSILSYPRMGADDLRLGEGYGARKQYSRPKEECGEDNQDQGDRLDHLHGNAVSALLRMVSCRIGIHEV